MAIQSLRWIREQAIKHGMIEPFQEKQVASVVNSYGLSSYGYDLRVSDEIKIFTPVKSANIDPIDDLRGKVYLCAWRDDRKWDVF
jgi:dCTP deaminase